MPHDRTSSPHPRPWTLAGGPDGNHGDEERARNFRLLTEPQLEELFRRERPRASSADYEVMIRDLNLVWECPDDGTVNVVGFRCGGCQAGREAVALADRCRNG